MHTFSLQIAGKVQGVFYRKNAFEIANQLGLTGFVRNEESGEVEIIATGTKEQLEALVAWCRQGPPRAKVEHVKVEEIPLQHFDSFAIRKHHT